MDSRQPLILLELNEVNFDFIQRYVSRGKLPAFAKLLALHGYSETTSEQQYEYLEPWIQWVTAHSGRTFAEHKVFRLGDIIHSDIRQIWESLEVNGVTVAAVSPINAANRTRYSKFFLPDPWTQTPTSGGRALRALHSALAQAVGDNAQQRITVRTLIRLVIGLAAHFRVSTIGQLVNFALHRRQKSWNASLFLDRFLADVFVRQWRKNRPEFSTLFLNAAAHIQHHYMFSSAVYTGPHRNPHWYVSVNSDPLLEVYSLYDRILADVAELPGAPRLMVVTGLHQEPYSSELFYYRLKNHEQFLRRLQLQFRSVAPRMSRDFTVYCASTHEARELETGLTRLHAPDGTNLFSVDNRGSDLFVMLSYPGEIGAGFVFRRDAEPMWDLAEDVAFVALKNGEHSGIGYFVDTRAEPIAGIERFPLSHIFRLVCAAMGVDPSATSVSQSDGRRAA